VHHWRCAAQRLCWRHCTFACTLTPACTSAFSPTLASRLQIWDRKRRVPNHLYRDPLATLFEEFDADCDGSLTVDEILNALKSEGVEITREQARP
jgi:hypothetical protein